MYLNEYFCAYRSICFGKTKFISLPLLLLKLVQKSTFLPLISEPDYTQHQKGKSIFSKYNLFFIPKCYYPA